MQGKFVCNQSASTFLFLNRFSMVIEPSSRIRQLATSGKWRPKRGHSPSSRRRSLLGQSEISFSTAGDRHGLRLVLSAFVPYDQRVATIWDVLDLIAAALIGLCEIRSRGNDEVSSHFGVHVTEQRHNARLVEGERSLLALGPGTEIVSGLLVAADRRPKDVMGDVVTVEEVDGCSLLHDYDVGIKHQALLIDHGMILGSRKGLARNRVNVNY